MLAAVLMAYGCGHKHVPESEPDPVLGIAIDFPAPTSTKADVGQLPATAQENAIHSLIVWVFRSDDHTLVSEPLILNENDMPDDLPVNGGLRRYALPVSRSFAATKPAVDVFVLANAASISSTLSAESTWDEINDAIFGDSGQAPYYGFGINHPVQAVDPGLGLPITGCGKNLSIEGEDPVLTVQTVKLSRAVSRIRFVFCKTPVDTEEGQSEDVVQIQSVTLESCMIPYYEYLFTQSASGVVYNPELEPSENFRPETFEIAWPSGQTLAENESPRDLVYANQDAVTYERLINDAVEDGRLTDLGYYYFRESDQRLRGKVTYTVNGGEPISRDFLMDSPGDFARNHTWTVYGYFVSGRNLQLDLEVLPWDYNVFHVDFETSVLSVGVKLTVDATTAEIVPSRNDLFDLDVRLLPNKAALCKIQVLAPQGGTLMIRPVGNASAFRLSKTTAEIHPELDNGFIYFTVDRSEDSDPDQFQYISLSFYVETTDGRVIDANTEAINDKYRFIL